MYAKKCANFLHVRIRGIRIIYIKSTLPVLSRILICKFRAHTKCLSTDFFHTSVFIWEQDQGQLCWKKDFWIAFLFPRYFCCILLSWSGFVILFISISFFSPSYITTALQCNTPISIVKRLYGYMKKCAWQTVYRWDDRLKINISLKGQRALKMKGMHLRTVCMKWGSIYFYQNTTDYSITL